MSTRLACEAPFLPFRGLEKGPLGVLESHGVGVGGLASLPQQWP